MSQPLYLSVEQSFRGQRALIVETINGLADAMETEVDARKPGSIAGPRPVDASTFLNIGSGQLARLAQMFANAEGAFRQAVAPSGSPRMYVDAYGDVLDDLKNVLDAISSVQPPSSFKRTYDAYRELVQTIYDQIAQWPKKMRQAAAAVKRDSYEMRLEVRAKPDAFEHALAADSKAIGI